MHPVSIISAFAFLGLLVMLGTGLAGFGVQRLRGQVHVGGDTGSRTVFLSLDVFLIALGLLLVFFGAMGTYRVVWGS